MIKASTGQSGISLVSVMIAAGIASGIALMIAKTNQTASKSVTKIKADLELEDFKSYMKSNFAKSPNCVNTYTDFQALHSLGGFATSNSDTISDTIQPPLVSDSPPPEYYEISNESDAVSNTFEIVTAVDAGAVVSTYTINADAPLDRFPNWSVNALRLYQIGEATSMQTGVCAINFRFKRTKNSKQTFGAEDSSFWITTNCRLNGEDMEFCMNSQSDIVGYWRLVDDTDPSQGVIYPNDVVAGSDVYVGGHVIVESDERIKKDIAPIYNASEKLSQLNGSYYFMRRNEFPEKNYSSDRQMGLIAQEVERFFPEAVRLTPDGLKAVRYTMLVPALIEAHKEQKQIIESQNKRINDLEHKIDYLLYRDLKNEEINFPK